MRARRHERPDPSVWNLLNRTSALGPLDTFAITERRLREEALLCMAAELVTLRRYSACPRFLDDVRDPSWSSFDGLRPGT